MKRATPELPLEFLLGTPKNDGFCWCGHCHHVLKLCQSDVDRLETAFAGGLQLNLKCPRCHHHKVVLKFPQVIKPKVLKAVTPERGKELFAEIFKKFCWEHN